MEPKDSIYTPPEHLAGAPAAGLAKKTSKLVGRKIMAIPLSGPKIPGISTKKDNDDEQLYCKKTDREWGLIGVRGGYSGHLPKRSSS
jgi:hypothetical protein